MTLEIEEIKQAMKIVTSQITTRLLSKNDTKIQIGLDPLNELWLIHEDGVLTLSGPLSSEIHPKYPDWVTFEKDSDQFRIIAQANPYAPEIAFLLIEVWKSIKMDPTTSLDHHIESSLSLIEKRWKLNGEPLDKRAQRGFIGEIEAVIHAFALKGMQAVDCWDHTSHAKHDIAGDGWAIEAKSRGADANIVTISSLNQLKWNEGVDLVLSVTTVKNDQNGVTFPEYVDAKTEELSNVDADSAAKFLLKLQTCGYNEATRHRFKSKWSLPEAESTEFYHICEDSPTNWWSGDVDPKMPDEIIVKGYKLDISSSYFEPCQLMDIFS